MNIFKVVDTDEHPRPVAADKMAALRPVFKKDGVVTAANASGICDGAGRQVPILRVFSFGDHVVRSRRISVVGGCHPAGGLSFSFKRKLPSLDAHCTKCVF